MLNGQKSKCWQGKIAAGSDDGQLHEFANHCADAVSEYKKQSAHVKVHALKKVPKAKAAGAKAKARA